MTALERPLRLDPLAEDDIAEACALSQAFGWPHRMADWRVMLNLGTGLAALDPERTLLGTGVRWTWEKRVSTVGLILVRPDRQGEGIGGRLLDGLLAPAPLPVRLYATPEGRRLYERRGFIPTGRAEQFQGQVETRPGPTSARRADPADRNAIIRLDAVAFGATRVPLIDHLLVDGEACVIGPPGAPVAFAVRRRFGHGNLIGPVTAPDVASARELMAALLKPGFNRIDLTPAGEPLVPTLLGWGLAHVASGDEMTKGTWPDRRASTSFALATQAFG